MPVTATVTMETTEELEAVITGVALASLSQLRNPSQARYIAPLYGGKIRYQAEPPGRERWQTALETSRLGYGDCEDLSAFFCAVAWHLGETGARILIVKPRPGLRHVVVRRADGRIEDPSKRLGM